MSNNRINTTISEENMQAITKSFRDIKEKLSFGVNLTDSEKQSLLKLSDKNRMFLRKVLEAINRHPDIVPNRFNVEELKNDVELHFQLANLLQESRLLTELLEDSYRLAGSEAYAGSLVAYKYLQAANVSTGELDAELDELGKLFTRKLPTPTKTQ
ncbi:MAG: hypothetical protein FD167_1101 [bacterium]|nr:MAG: hypothetical protein FD167_1101 [bacterium]